MSPDQLTIIVPTFNRHASLACLAECFRNQKSETRFLILDSSEVETAQANEAAFRATGLKTEYRHFPETVDPYEKFLWGLRHIETPYCAFCADDDVLSVETALECARFLAANSDFSLCHGYYFNYKLRQQFDISHWQYRGSSNSEDDPLRRIIRHFDRYEATFYGVHRSTQLAEILAFAQKAPLTLYKELIASALTIVCGKSHRIPKWYYGRNVGPSIAYNNWHPHEILAKDPTRLFEGYVGYREILSHALESATKAHSPARIRKVLDIVHLKYLAPLLDRGLLRYIVDESLAGRSGKDIVDGIWDIWVTDNRPYHPRRKFPPNRFYRVEWRIKAFLNEFIARYFRGSSSAPLSLLYPYRDFVQTGLGSDGLPRDYLIYHEFLHPEGSDEQEPTAAMLDALVAVLAAYPLLSGDRL